MGKQIKKKTPRKISKHYKECIRCGNGGITRIKAFRCKYCGQFNGEDGELVIKRGGLDD